MVCDSAVVFRARMGNWIKQRKIWIIHVIIKWTTLSIKPWKMPLQTPNVTTAIMHVQSPFNSIRCFIWVLVLVMLARIQAKRSILSKQVPWHNGWKQLVQQRTKQTEIISSDLEVFSHLSQCQVPSKHPSVCSNRGTIHNISYIMHCLLLNKLGLRVKSFSKRIVDRLHTHVGQLHEFANLYRAYFRRRDQ